VFLRLVFCIVAFLISSADPPLVSSPVSPLISYPLRPLISCIVPPLLLQLFLFNCTFLENFGDALWSEVMSDIGVAKGSRV
jgi:hypothetical protein